MQSNYATKHGFMIKLKNQLRLICCVLASIFVLDLSGQVTICANRAEVTTAATCLGCGVTNPDNGADCSLGTTATITANLLLSGGVTYDLFFDGFTGAAGDTVELYFSPSNNGAINGTTINSFGTDGTGQLQQNADSRALSQTSITTVGGLLRLRFFPESVYSGIRLVSNAADGGNNFTLDIARANVLKGFVAGPQTPCEEPNIQTNSLGGTCTGGFCEVSNPDAILTDTEDDFATISVSAGLLAGSAELTGFWNQTACNQDSARIVLQSNNTPSNSTITINAIQKANPGDAGTVVATLNVPALGTQKSEFYIHPGVPFNAVQVEVAVGAGFNDASIRVYAICLKRVVPPMPLNNQRNISVCFGDSATLETVPYNNEVARWYTQRTGGSPIFTGNTFETGSLTSDTTFYYEGFIPGQTGCVSSYRDSFVVDVAAITPPSTGVSGTQVACFNEPFTVSPRPQGNVFTFYSANDTTELITANTFTFATVTSDTAILVQNTQNGRCGSDSLIKVNVQLFDEPVIAQPLDSIGVCLDTTTGLPANNLIGIFVQNESPTGFNTTYRLYNRNMQRIGVAGGAHAEFQFGDTVYIPISQFAVTPAGQVDSLFVDAVSGPCYESGNKQKIILFGVNPTTVVPEADDVYVCNGESATLTVNNPDPKLYYYWFTQPEGGSPVAMGSSVTVPAPSDTMLYYVEGNYGSDCVTPGRDTVRVIPLSAVGSPFDNLDVITCTDSTAVFDLTEVAVQGATYSWYTQPTGGAPIFVGDSFVTNNITTPTTFYLEIDNVDCQSRFAATVDTTSPPDLAIDEALRYACLGDVVALTATSSDNRATFDWFDNPVFGAGSKLGEGSPFAYTPDFSGGDIVDVYVQSRVDQCPSEDRSLIRVENITTRQEPLVSPEDTSVCQGQSVTFDIIPRLNSELVSYSWWDAASGGTRLSTTESFSTPSLNSSQTYFAQLELSDPTVCLSRGRTEVNVEALPKLTSPRLNTDCVADENNVTYTWNAVTGATSYQYEINITVNGNTTTRTGSTTSTSFVVDNLEPNSVVEFNLRALGSLPCQTSETSTKTCVSNVCGLDNLAPQQAFYLACENTTITVGIQGVPNNAQVTVQGNPASDNGNGNWSAQVQTVDIPGGLEVNQTVIFRVSLPNTQGCDPVDLPVTIRVAPTPEGKITIIPLDPAVIGGKIQEFQFIADFTGGDKTWAWDFGDGETSNEKNPIHFYDEDGEYTVTLLINTGTSEFTCEASATAKVFVTSIPDLFVPNTFTPNGDGANDQWRVFGRNLVNENYKVRIFNTYGNVVFESDDLDDAWDGKFEGEPAKMGTYYFTLVVYDAIGQKLEREGTINLIRK